MHLLKSVAALAVLFFAVSVFSSDSWTFDPDIHKSKVKDGHISFTEKGNKQAECPELYAEDTDVEFYNLVQNLVNKAKRSKTPVDFYFVSYESTNNGTYYKIVPQD